MSAVNQRKTIDKVQVCRYFDSGDGDPDKCYELFVRFYERYMDMNRLQSQLATQEKNDSKTSPDIMRRL